MKIFEDDIYVWKLMLNINDIIFNIINHIFAFYYYWRFIHGKNISSIINHRNIDIYIENISIN